MENFLKKTKDFLFKYQNVLNILLLGVLCGLFLFVNLGKYPLIDIDETRYVNMSRDMLALGDWVTPYLNFENFLEKPPLYFWLNVLAYKLFGATGNFVSRFMTASIATFSVLFTYIFSYKIIKSKAYALISSCVLLSSMWFLVLSHIAILDMGFMATSMATIYFAVLALFVEEKNKKFMWYLAYFSMATSVLMKGLIGIIVPVLVVFLAYLFARKIKELFKPLYLIPGVIIFLLVALPWHILIYKAHGSEWVVEYIVKHHFARFLDSSMGLGRKEPFVFYLPVVLIGLIPWTMNFVAQIVCAIKSAIKDIKAAKSFKVVLATDTNDRKMLLFATIYAISTFLFFSASSTKLPTYALTFFPPLALIIGYFWWGYVCFDKYSKAIRISSAIMSAIFLIAGVAATILLFYPIDILLPFISKIKDFGIIVCAWFIILPIISFACIKLKNRAALFVSQVIFMLGVILISTLKIFPFITTFGQSELENYAKIAHMENAEFVTFGFARKYSIMSYYDKKIHYITGYDDDSIANFKETLKDLDNKKFYFVIKNKNLDEFSSKGLLNGYKKAQKGEFYSLYTK